jgi:hypothetical protein
LLHENGEYRLLPWTAAPELAPHPAQHVAGLRVNGPRMCQRAPPGPPRRDCPMTAPLRHMCRNPRCRMKLSEPTENERRAFCCKGCHAMFYRRRCVVCERDLPPGPPNRKLCRSAKCRNEYARFPHLFRFATGSTAPGTGNRERDLRSAIKSGTKTRVRAAPRSLFGPTTLPLNILGGYRFAEAPKLETGLRRALLLTESS